MDGEDEDLNDIAASPMKPTEEGDEEEEKDKLAGSAKKKLDLSGNGAKGKEEGTQVKQYDSPPALVSPLMGDSRATEP